MEDDFSIFHTGNFLPFHRLLKFSSIFHSIPRYSKLRPEATRNLYCTFATLSIPLQVVAREGKQHGTMHLIPYLKHYCYELPKKITQHENINHLSTDNRLMDMH